MVDFGVYRTAGARAIEAAPLFRPEDGHYQFKYFPAFALAMTPLAVVPEAAAKAIWFGVSVALLVVLVRISIRTLPDRRQSERFLAWLAVVLMAKFYLHELNHGQTNILLAVLLVGALAAAMRGRASWAGVLVGAGVFVKPYALILVPWLWFAAGPASLVAFAATFAGGLLLPAAVYGWSGNLEQIGGWYRTVTDTTAPNLLAPENVSVATMWAKWLGPGPTASSLATTTAVVVVAMAAVAWLWRRRVRQPAYLEFGLLMMLVPLLSPQGWDYVLLIAMPAYALLVDRWRELPVNWRAVAIAAFVFTSFTIFDLLGRSLYTQLMQLGAVTVGAALIAICLIRLRSQASA